jgi:tetratricopeptide (TPR) repeat protein
VKRRSVQALIGVVLALVVRTAPAVADTDFEEATRRFERGSQLFLERRYADALAELERSYALHPSPNSLLLIARCERDLGRFELAAEHFAKATAAAEARVSAGESQYRETVESARGEGATVRAMLGTIRVRVPGAPAGTLVETPHTRALLDASGGAEVLHRPGPVRVRVKAPDGRSATRSVTVSARAWADLELALDRDQPASRAPPPPRRTPEPEPDRAPGEESSWMLPAGIVLGAAGIVGMGSFAYFGSKSRATYRDLEGRCAPLCGADERDDADRAETQQTIANVSLIAGGVALLAGTTLVILHATRGPSAERRASRMPRRARFIGTHVAF